MRKNVLTWLTTQVPNARHALILTHNIHLLFVQSVLASKLREAGNPKLTIFADAMCAAQAFVDQGALLDGLGVRYRVVPVDLGAARRFHPKAILLAGPERAALVIGSGNLTHGGMAANHEAWTFAVSDGEGASLIAAFRDYLAALVPTMPLAKPLEDELDAAFDQTRSWVADLPLAAGLASSPSNTPLLDQIAQFVTGEVRAISVLAPYHDDNAVALSTIADRFGVPVTCWMQPGREGLARSAAAVLPQNVILKSIDCEEARRPSFIHAKVFAFHRDDDVVLAVGSANCSQAALLADRSWGNAELMAVDIVSHEDADVFLSELVRSDQAPNLPDQPQSDDWETDAPVPLRILAARHEGDRLDIAFRAASPVTKLVVEADAGTWPAVNIDSARGLATFTVPQRLRTILLKGRGSAGEGLVSPEAWVDNEASLAAPATLRRVLGRLQDGETEGADPAQTFRGVLELFRDYLRDPEAARRRIRRPEDMKKPPGPYDPAAVFADDFGRVGSPVHHGGADARDSANMLSIIEALFAISQPVSGVVPPPTDDGEEEDTEVPDFEAAEEALIRKVRKTPNDKISGQLRRALIAVEQALREPAFVEARSPTLLGADLALAAILLVKGLADGLLEVTAFRESTRKLWGTLFFGEKQTGIAGMIPVRVDQISDPAEREAFVAALVTPRLAATLTLWSTTEWNAGDADSLWFRFSAAQLQARYPWLFAAAAPGIVAAELQAMAAGLLPPNERATATRTWIDVIRAGAALQALEVALKKLRPDDLRAATNAPNVKPTDLIWVNGKFAFPIGNFLREDRVKARVHFLGESEPSLYRASYLLPVRELVVAGALDLPINARDDVLNLVDTITRLVPALA